MDLLNLTREQITSEFMFRGWTKAPLSLNGFTLSKNQYILSFSNKTRLLYITTPIYNFAFSTLWYSTVEHIEEYLENYVPRTLSDEFEYFNKTQVIQEFEKAGWTKYKGVLIKGAYEVSVYDNTLSVYNLAYSKEVVSVTLGFYKSMVDFESSLNSKYLEMKYWSVPPGDVSYGLEGIEEVISK